MATLSKAASVAAAQNQSGGRSPKGGGGALKTVRSLNIPSHIAPSVTASANALVASAHPDTIKNTVNGQAAIAGVQSRSSYGGGGALTGNTPVTPRVVVASVQPGQRSAPTTNDNPPVPMERDIRLPNVSWNADK